ncbi:MAG TPA: PAS domain-containing protein [Hanamia sp.]|nr:PAS domain-containing protein [Hanamia sp.]
MIIPNNPITILIVEDNATDYLILKDLLQRMRLPVKKIIHAVSMEAATSIIANTNFDVVLLNLSLPDSTGVDSIITMERLLPKTAIICLSGLTGEDTAIESISLGAQDYLVKGDFDEKLLAKTIQHSIERKKILENLHLSNERFKLINKATLDTTWDLNFEDNIGQWGEGIIRTFGYSEENLLFNFDIWKKWIHPDDSERVMKNLNYHLKNQLKNWQDEYRFKAADDSYKDVFSRGYLLFSNSGKATRMFGSTTDITERKKLEKELAEQQLNQQKLITETTILAQEKERNEIGKELHDNINQILATVKLYHSMMRSNENDRDELLAKASEYVNDAIEEIRKLSKSLVSPTLGDITLKQALNDLVDEVNKTPTLQLSLNYKVEEGKIIGSKKELMIYRVVQEQVNNILKHSEAKRATIELKTKETELILTISDDGIGFDTKERSKGIGLQNISSRVEFYSGKLDIISKTGNGCKLKIIIPC